MSVTDRTIEISNLKSFAPVEGLPRDDDGIQKVLRSSVVQKVRCFALGPEGTNISQACRKWIDRMAIDFKTVVELGETPEKCLEMARMVAGPGEIGIFWTCAVFYALNKLFFENPDVYPFFIEEVMLLDEMQLATRTEVVERFGGRPLEQWEEGWQKDMQVASHPSPAPLVKGCFHELAVVKANSNAYAAQLCVKGQVDFCITTEKARKLHGLEKVHSFGSPEMVFFGGITGHGAQVVREAYQDVI